MDVPRSKLGYIRRQHSGDAQRCSRACWELYLKDHPSPAWQLVANALYQEGHLEELEVVLKKYLKGERGIDAYCNPIRVTISKCHNSVTLSVL